jgi:hypothetical protein
MGINMSRKLTQEEAEAKSLTVGIRMVGVYEDSVTKIEFECPFCKNIFLARLSHIYSLGTKSCGCLKIKNIQKSLKTQSVRDKISKANWRGTKDIRHGYFSVIKKSAKLRNIELSISIDYIQELLEQQDYKCALTGIPIKMARNHDKKYTTYSEQTASLDRIDSSKGYIEGNVQWVHKDVNNMKQDLSETRLIELCKLIVEKSKLSS